MNDIINSNARHYIYQKEKQEEAQKQEYKARESKKRLSNYLPKSATEP